VFDLKEFGKATAYRRSLRIGSLLSDEEKKRVEPQWENRPCPCLQILSCSACRGPRGEIILVRFQHRGKWLFLGIAKGYAIEFNSPAVPVSVSHRFGIKSEDTGVTGRFTLGHRQAQIGFTARHRTLRQLAGGRCADHERGL